MTDHYAVVGNPVAHSKSPQIHALFARETGQDLAYGRILAPLDGFAAAVREFRAQGGKGLNVTVPFKGEAWQLATELSERAALAEAVNTLKFEGDAVIGDNTDGAGLIRDIRENLGFALRGSRILLMGAGGAARGVLQPLLAEAPASLVIANRTPEKAEALARKFAAHGPVTASSYADLANRRFDLVINATAASLHDELPPLPGDALEGVLAYDMMYGKAPTPFLRFAGEHRARQLANGLGMLVEQAAESFHLWRGVRPATRPVIAAVKSAL